MQNDSQLLMNFRYNFNKSKFIAELECTMKNDNKNCYLDVKRLRGKRLQQYHYIAKKSQILIF
jgi:hypothetical protein